MSVEIIVYISSSLSEVVVERVAFGFSLLAYVLVSQQRYYHAFQKASRGAGICDREKSLILFRSTSYYQDVRRSRMSRLKVRLLRLTFSK